MMSTWEDMPAPVIPSHSAESEQGVLGALLINNAGYDDIADLLRPEHFYRGDHREIYSVVVQLLSNSKVADSVTVCETLDKRGRLEYAGGMSYIASLVHNTPSALNIKRYAEIVRERWLLRSLSGHFNEAQELVASPGNRSASEVLDVVQSKLQLLADLNDRIEQHGFDQTQLAKRIVAKIDELYTAGSPEVTGVDTGWPEMNKLTAGWQPGNLVIVAGRPSMGKTAFAMNCAENIAIFNQEALPTLVFSMEMEADEVGMRMFSSVGRIPQERLKRGALEDDDWQRLTMAAGRISESQMFVDESPALNLLEIRTRARRYQRKVGRIGMIVVDYIQLMSPVDTGRESNRATELGEISRGLKALAKELRTTVVALSQLSRKVEERANKRPIMSDLRESGAIEQDADMIVMLYRDEYYNPDSDQKGILEAIVGKHRNGPTGTLRMYFRGEISRVEPIANQWLTHTE